MPSLAIIRMQTITPDRLYWYWPVCFTQNYKIYIRKGDYSKKSTKQSKMETSAVNFSWKTIRLLNQIEKTVIKCLPTCMRVSCWLVFGLTSTEATGVPFSAHSASKDLTALSKP